jgi:hypothetical protein
MRPLIVNGVIVALLLSAAAVHACTGGDEPVGIWSLDRKDYEGASGLPFLSPGNDSRLNLQLLMLDAHPRPAATPAPAPAAGAPSAPADVDLDTTPLFLRSELEATFKPAPPRPPGATNDDQGSSLFAEGEGSRCASSPRGRQEFADAVQAAPALSADEKTLLVNERNGMAPTCVKPVAGDGPASAAPQAALSPAAQEFFVYLGGAKAFYAGDFDSALDAFGKLAKSDNSWLRETASYMAGRTLLNKGEVGVFEGFDGVAPPKVVDRASLDASEAALKTYLAAYPAGRYAASARGLLRRVYWLVGDSARLSAEYSWQIAHVAESQANLDGSDLAAEIDSKLLSDPKSQAHDPNLLTVADLMRMRAAVSDKRALPAADLEAQAPDFVGRESLFAFLKAARAYYVDGNFAATLNLLGPAPSGPLSPPYLAFSREALRGQALMASGQLDAAAEHWKALLPRATEPWQREAVELGLSLAWERAGTLNKVFTGDTRIASPRIRAVLLRYSAGPILLRQAVADPQSTPSERALARFILLFKQATRGHYSGFLRDYSPEAIAKGDAEATTAGAVKSAAFVWKGASEPYACPALKTVIGELDANPESSHGLLCLTEFIRTNDLEGAEGVKPRAEQLGGAKSIFPGEDFSRGEIYKKLVAESSTPENDKAYALYRLVNCYGPAASNGCGGKDVDKAQRKAWFQALKTKYGSTPWARKATYYW